MKHTEKPLEDGYKFAGQQWKRPRRSVELNRPANKSYKEVCTLGVASSRHVHVHTPNHVRTCLKTVRMSF